MNINIPELNDGEVVVFVIRKSKGRMFEYCTKTEATKDTIAFKVSQSAFQKSLENE